MPNVWKNLPPGVLNDTAIREVQTTLFTAGFQEESVKQCCYEFHVGDQIIDLSKDEEDRITALAEGDFFLIRPRSSVVVKLAEQIKLPKDCLARFLLKGKFFSVGIAPVNTYADPGFNGHMGMVLTNTTNHYLRLSRGEAISKAEFIKLPSEVKDAYHGQHGFQTGHWPILQQYRAKPDDLKAKGVIPESKEQLQLVHGTAIADTIARLRYYTRVMWIQLAVVTASLILIIHYSDKMGAGLSLTLGIVANLITTLVLVVVRPALPAKWRGEL